MPRRDHPQNRDWRRSRHPSRVAQVGDDCAPGGLRGPGGARSGATPGGDVVGASQDKLLCLLAQPPAGHHPRRTAHRLEGHRRGPRDALRLRPT
ncbi:hypothetical protein ZIOFF_061268 [Zingiber officinale]|uniref:Uncharacterized protein n=1 Tax=Zingiber officinale TaxID=94328 RepID=A0A8J5K9M4_ZINOF|nr:hypothetical protein ZIOFF_061268 [Zingiber officinale]